MEITPNKINSVTPNLSQDHSTNSNAQANTNNIAIHVLSQVASTLPKEPVAHNITNSGQNSIPHIIPNQPDTPTNLSLQTSISPDTPDSSRSDTHNTVQRPPKICNTPPNIPQIAPPISHTQSLQSMQYDPCTQQFTLSYPNGDSYQGQMQNLKPHGHGKMIWGFISDKNATNYQTQGTVYVGQWNDGLPNGKGVMTKPNNSTYRGDFVCGKYHGKGTYHSSKTSYVGDWKEGERHGSGTCINLCGDEYTGKWIYDKRWGSGTCKYKNGLTYSGQWYDNKPHKTGKIKFPNEPAIKGFVRPGPHSKVLSLVNAKGDLLTTFPWTTIRENKKRTSRLHDPIPPKKRNISSPLPEPCSFNQINPSPTAPHPYPETSRKIINYPDGSVYSGEINNNKPHGHGTMMWGSVRPSHPNKRQGTLYIGSWVGGKMQGSGTLKQTNHSTYEGDFYNNLFHGKGTLSSSLTKYSGFWREGMKHGFGTCITRDKEKYTGIWTRGRPNKYGEKSYAEGYIYVGVFYDHKPHNYGKIIFADGSIIEGKITPGPKEHLVTIVAKDNNTSFTFQWKKRSAPETPNTVAPTATPTNSASLTKTPTPENVMSIENILDDASALRSQHSDASASHSIANNTMHFANNDLYTGQTLNGKPHGFGKIQSFSSQQAPDAENQPFIAEYEGAWRHGEKYGHGIARYTNHQIYLGDWQNNIPNGKGTLVYGNGDLWHGSFKKSHPDGRCQLMRMNKEILTVTWVNGKPTGNARFKLSQGGTICFTPSGQNPFKFCTIDLTNGNKISSASYEKGKLHGAQSCIFKNETRKYSVKFSHGEFTSGSGKISTLSDWNAFKGPTTQIEHLLKELSEIKDVLAFRSE